MEMTRRNLLTALAVLTGGATFKIPSIAAATEELVVTTYGGSWEKFWRDTLLPGFVEASGDSVKLDIGLGRVYTTNMRAAGKDNPPYGVLMTNEIYATVLREEGFFEKLDLEKLPNYTDLYPIATRAADGWGAVGLISPIGIGYRTDLVSTPPKSWKDLWDNEEFSGKIGLYNIVNSAGKMFLMLTSKIYGSGIHDIETGFAKLAELGPVIQTDFNMSTFLASGECIVAPFDFGEIARLRNQGLPVDCIIPEEGLMMWDQTFNICLDQTTRDAAYRYLDYVLSPEGQNLLMREFFVSPVNRTVEVPSELQKDVPVYGDAMESFVDWDWAFMNADAESIARRWNETFGV